MHHFSSVLNLRRLRSQSLWALGAAGTATRLVDGEVLPYRPYATSARS